MIRILCALVLAAVAFVAIGAGLYAVAPVVATHSHLIPVLGISLTVMQLAGITGGTLVFAKFAKK